MTLPERDPLSLAEIAMQEQRYFDAYRAYRKALTTGQESPEMWNNMGVALAHLDFYLAAENRFKRAIALSPGYQEARNNLQMITEKARHFRSRVNIPHRLATTSIVILTFNQVGYTKLCLESLFSKTPEMLELIVVDNASHDETPSYLTALQQQYPDRIRLILNKENRGFAAGCNQGAAIAKGEEVLFLNNDIIVSYGWLARLLAAMDRQEVDVVGPSSRHVLGEQAVTDLPIDFLHEEDILEEYAQQRAILFQAKGKYTHRLVGFCLLVTRKVLETIGGFDPRFGTGNFEDDDFCYRALLSGFKLWWAKDVFVQHFGNISFQGAGIDHRQAMRKNWGIFCEKWGLPADLNHSIVHNPIESIIEKDWEPDLYVPFS